MRISNKVLTNRFTENVNRTLELINKYNNQIATGKKVSKSSDAPDDISLILRFKRAIANIDQYSRNIDAGLSFLKASDSALIHTTEQVRLAQNLAVEAANDPTLFSDSAISGLVADIEGIKEEVLAQANTQISGKYIFSGYSTKTRPYTNTSNGYRGDTFDILAKISDDNNVAMNITGDVAFRESSVTGEVLDLTRSVGRAINLYDTTIPESSGTLATIIAAPAEYTGTDSGNYRVEVIAGNAVAGDVGGTQLQLIFNDGAGDTIIATSAVLAGGSSLATVNFPVSAGLTFSTEINLAGATTTLNVGELTNTFDVAGDVRFTVSDGTNTSAEIVLSAAVSAVTPYTAADIKAIIDAAIANGSPAAPTISYDYDSDGRPVFSIDPANSTGVMEFTNTSAGTNSTTKGRLYDMFNITEGFKNVFGILDDFKAAVEAKDAEEINRLLSRFDNVEAEILKNDGVLGARIRSLENSRAHLDKLKDERRKLLSELEDADPTESITNLTNQQNSYESVLYYGVLIQRTSLLDFLR